MVRLQRIAYEQIVNTKTLGRARTLTSPAKWYTTNPNEHMKRLSHQFFYKSFVGRLLRPFYRAWFLFETRFQRDHLLQQGLTFQDKFLHADVELRRSILWQHVARESLHPYHWVLKRYRRERFWRIERGIRGFFVPEYVRSEVKTQTYLDYVRLNDEWWSFFHNNYGSDITPTARRTAIPHFIPIDLLMNYGLLRPEAWQRYFFTERDQNWMTEKQVQVVRDRKRFPYDLTTAEGKKQFENTINTVNSKYPGLVAPEGQSFDFAKYYAEVGVSK